LLKNLVLNPVVALKVAGRQTLISILFSINLLSKSAGPLRQPQWLEHSGTIARWKFLPKMLQSKSGPLTALLTALFTINSLTNGPHAASYE
jgi:hypothetical protein